jgi:glutamyl-tRNA synthetase
VSPVVRFRNPPDGHVSWDDLVKGRIAISNREIDDLIIMRPAAEGATHGTGVPTYNFAVVVDDWDMNISHVFRGDEHVNNTPWQINIFNALGAPLPLFGHVPIILGDDGQKLSKRRGAVSVTSYEEAGYLPEAMLNYLARLGWSHGDEELFSRAQLVQWFDGQHLSKSPAQWDAAKLAWVNAHYIKQSDDASLAGLVARQLQSRGIRAEQGDILVRMCGLFKDRCATIVELADWLGMYFVDVSPSAEEVALHVTDVVRPALRSLRDALAEIDWTKAAIASAVKQVLAAHGLKMSQLAHAVRVLVCGRAQTPSLDAVLELFPRDTVLSRLRGV